MAHHDITMNYSDSEREFQRAKLKKVMLTLFYRYPDLHYIQGFHDICTIILLICGDECKSYAMIEGLANAHFRESLRPSLDRIVKILDWVLPLVARADPKVGHHLKSANMPSFFTLSWILTWFSHNFTNFETICRIFDFLLAHHPVLSVYLAASFIISRREELLKLDQDYAAIHAFFQNMPDELDIDVLLSSCNKLYLQFPPVVFFKNRAALLPPDSPLFLTNLPPVPSQRNWVTSLITYRLPTVLKHLLFKNGRPLVVRWLVLLFALLLHKDPDLNMLFTSLLMSLYRLARIIIVAVLRLFISPVDQNPRIPIAQPVYV